MRIVSVYDDGGGRVLLGGQYFFVAVVVVVCHLRNGRVFLYVIGVRGEWREKEKMR